MNVPRLLILIIAIEEMNQELINAVIFSQKIIMLYKFFAVNDYLKQIQIDCKTI